MRLATAANEVYTASLAVSELLGCKQCGGSRGQDEVPGRGTGREGGYPANCLGFTESRRFSALAPTASENAPQGGRLWSNRSAGALPGGAWQAGPRPSGEGAASGGLGGRLPLRVVPGQKVPRLEEKAVWII